MQAIIIAGGKGTRISSLTTTIPKLLLPLNNKPLIDYSLNYLVKNDCNNVIICAGHLGDQIKKYLQQKNFGITINTFIENEPFGTAGALLPIKDLLEDEFIVLFGDIFTTINIKKMIKFHKQKKSDVTLALHHSDHPEDSTIVNIDKNNKLLKFVEKPGANWLKYGNLTKTSLYIIKKSILDFIPEDKKIDFDEVFFKMLKKRKKLFGYVTAEYIKDIGTPRRYKEVQDFISTSS